MDLQKRSDMLTKAKKALSEKSANATVHKNGKKTAYENLNMLFDEGTFVETNAFVKTYSDDFTLYGEKEYEGVVCGYGAVDGRLVFAYSQDISRQNGAFSKAAAQKISNLYDLALKNGAPVISMFDSLGAKVLEGVEVLSGYGAVMKKAASVKGKLPQVSIVLGDACGAVSIIASMADFSVICDGASFSVTPANVLDEFDAKKGVGSATFAAENGLVSDIMKTPEEAVTSAKKILSYLPSNRLDKNIYAGCEDDINRETPEIASVVSNDNYNVFEIIKAISDGGDYKEITSQKCKSLITAFAFIGGMPCGIIANNPSENGGKICAGGLRKAADFINVCDSFNISVVTLVGTDGFDEKCEAHGGRVNELAASLAKEYALCKSPVITVNVGKAYGTAFALMGSKALGADMVFALDSAKISVLKPSSSVNMLWNEKLQGVKSPIEKRKSLEEDFELYMSTPVFAANAGQIDDIITASELRKRIASSLEMLSMKTEFISL